MSILSSTGRIFLVKTPVSGRFGLARLLAQLSSQAFGVRWDGIEELTIITFNKTRTICKILHTEDKGVDCVTRKLNKGTFKVLFDEELIPERLTLDVLERLLNGEDVEELKNNFSEDDAVAA
ncbi:MAG: IS66 family insertion sequence element accessory protein TnpB [Succinivibrio sp.]|nr:IS66 family insertion sequence element accessory protein TnpB [Succinivibrio sp.]MDY5722471.1 IS66 family insertion sequence element accessory protein TnpB [Succinivibrio sp.]